MSRFIFLTGVFLLALIAVSASFAAAAAGIRTEYAQQHLRTVASGKGSGVAGAIEAAEIAGRMLREAEIAREAVANFSVVSFASIERTSKASDRADLFAKGAKEAAKLKPNSYTANRNAEVAMMAARRAKIKTTIARERKEQLQRNFELMRKSYVDAKKEERLVLNFALQGFRARDVSTEAEWTRKVFNSAQRVEESANMTISLAKAVLGGIFSSKEAVEDTERQLDVAISAFEKVNQANKVDPHPCARHTTFSLKQETHTFREQVITFSEDIEEALIMVTKSVDEIDQMEKKTRIAMQRIVEGATDASDSAKQALEIQKDIMDEAYATIKNSRIAASIARSKMLILKGRTDVEVQRIKLCDFLNPEQDTMHIFNETSRSAATERADSLDALVVATLALEVVFHAQKVTEDIFHGPQMSPGNEMTPKRRSNGAGAKEKVMNFNSKDADESIKQDSLVSLFTTTVEKARQLIGIAVDHTIQQLIQRVNAATHAPKSAAKAVETMDFEQDAAVTEKMTFIKRGTPWHAKTFDNVDKVTEKNKDEARKAVTNVEEVVKDAQTAKESVETSLREVVDSVELARRQNDGKDIQKFVRRAAEAAQKAKMSYETAKRAADSAAAIVDLTYSLNGDMKALLSRAPEEAMEVVRDGVEVVEEALATVVTEAAKVSSAASFAKLSKEKADKAAREAVEAQNDLTSKDAAQRAEAAALEAEHESRNAHNALQHASEAAQAAKNAKQSAEEAIREAEQEQSGNPFSVRRNSNNGPGTGNGAGGSYNCDEHAGFTDAEDAHPWHHNAIRSSNPVRTQDAVSSSARLTGNEKEKQDSRKTKNQADISDEGDEETAGNRVVQKDTDGNNAALASGRGESGGSLAHTIRQQGADAACLAFSMFLPAMLLILALV